MKSFTNARIPELRFGIGVFRDLPDLLQLRGFTRIAVVTGGRSFRSSPTWALLLDWLKSRAVDMVDFSVSHEPDPDFVNSATGVAASFGAQAVVGIGGGSAIDAGKAISALAAMGGRIEEYLEGVGTKKPTGKKLPFFAVPTTSGTGSEATKNAVISKIGPDGFKKSFRHDAFVPDVAIVDPALSLHCPAETTAATGLDAITQLLEAYVSTGANPVTDAFAESGLESARRGFLSSLRGAHEGASAVGGDAAYLEARSQMAYAAYLSGVCLASAGLGIVHGIASPMGAMFPVPHGVVCGSLLSGSVQATIRKLETSEPGGAVLAKYARAAELLGAGERPDIAGQCAALVELLREWTEESRLPRLSRWNIDENGARAIARVTVGKTHPTQFAEAEVASLIMSRI
ncbi:MAG TPA: iron-containing alcohol dehydrogenase [Spirochaetia bacterium]|nr:iron-containing alcohol dehydrogenase [Spirochaetia bacterium]